MLLMSVLDDRGPLCGQRLNREHAAAVADGAFAQRGPGEFFLTISVILGWLA
jgi:hypothetical protein